MKQPIFIFIVLLATLSNALVPNVIENEEKCGLGIQNTRKFCTSCTSIGQMSAASQNRHMRMKIACLSLITNQCCSLKQFQTRPFFVDAYFNKTNFTWYWSSGRILYLLKTKQNILFLQLNT